MATQKASKVALSNALIERIVDVYESDTLKVRAAIANVDTLKGARLVNMVSACAGLAPVTQEAWDAVASAGLARFSASSRFDQTGKRRDSDKALFSAITQFSAVKIAVMALSHGVAPSDGQSFDQFVSTSRMVLAKRGLIVTVAKEPKAGEIKSKSGKATSTGPISRDAMALALVDGADDMADLIKVICDPANRALVKAWGVKLLARIEADKIDF